MLEPSSALSSRIIAILLVGAHASTVLYGQASFVLCEKGAAAVQHILDHSVAVLGAAALQAELATAAEGKLLDQRPGWAPPAR